MASVAEVPNGTKTETPATASRNRSFNRCCSFYGSNEDGNMKEPTSLVATSQDNEKQIKPPVFLRVAGAAVNLMMPLLIRKDGTVNRKLLNVLLQNRKANSKAVKGIFSTHVVVDKDTDLWVRIFAHADVAADEKLPVMVYFHGGGFAICSPAARDFDSLLRALARACRMIVIAVNYRKAPEFRYPVAYDDCFRVVKWIRAPSSAEFLPPSADLSRCFFAGDSAGGNIVHFMGCRAAETDLQPLQLRGMIMFQPFFGGVGQTGSDSVKGLLLVYPWVADWLWKSFLPEGADRSHPACSVFGPNAPDISGLKLPPIFVALGSHDILLDRQEQYISKLEEMFGNEAVTVKRYQGGVHSFYAYHPRLRKRLLVDVATFVKASLTV